MAMPISTIGFRSTAAVTFDGTLQTRELDGAAAAPVPQVYVFSRYRTAEKKAPSRPTTEVLKA